MAIICNKHSEKYELKSEKWVCMECEKERKVKPPPRPPTVVIDPK